MSVKWREDQTDYSFGPTDYSAPPTLLDMLLYDSASEEQSRLQRWDALDRQFASIVSSDAVVGHDYVSGREGPDSFDCSGVTFFGIKQVVPGFPDKYRLSADGYFNSQFVTADYGGTTSGVGRLINYDYFPTTKPGIDHVTVDLGNGTMVHASSGGAMRVLIAPHSLFNGYRENTSEFRRLNWDNIQEASGK